MRESIFHSVRKSLSLLLKKRLKRRRCSNVLNVATRADASLSSPETSSANTPTLLLLTGTHALIHFSPVSTYTPFRTEPKGVSYGTYSTAKFPKFSVTSEHFNVTFSGNILSLYTQVLPCLFSSAIRTEGKGHKIQELRLRQKCH